MYRNSLSAQQRVAQIETLESNSDKDGSWQKCERSKAHEEVAAFCPLLATSAGIVLSCNLDMDYANVYADVLLCFYRTW
jgi:hypothetical protein